MRSLQEEARYYAVVSDKFLEGIRWWLTGMGALVILPLTGLVVNLNRFSGLPLEVRRFGIGYLVALMMALLLGVMTYIVSVKLLGRAEEVALVAQKTPSYLEARDDLREGIRSEYFLLRVFAVLGLCVSGLALLLLTEAVAQLG